IGIEKNHATSVLFIISCMIFFYSYFLISYQLPIINDQLSVISFHPQSLDYQMSYDWVVKKS
ncbi:MAG: hypothetical protein AAFR37_14315, partial [Cyanobacteria bacterium J06628_3]